MTDEFEREIITDQNIKKMKHQRCQTFVLVCHDAYFSKYYKALPGQLIAFIL